MHVCGVCVCVCEYVYLWVVPVGIGVHEVQGHQFPLHLELQVVVNSPDWVLEAELWSTGRAECTFNQRTISPAPAHLHFKD